MAIVYLATNRLNGKRYVGFTTLTLERRRQKHLTDARNGRNSAFQAAIRKHGAEAFDWCVLAEGAPEDMLDMEDVMIERHGSMAPGGYNLRRGGGPQSKIGEVGRARNSTRMKAFWENNREAGLRAIREGAPKSRETRRLLKERDPDFGRVAPRDVLVGVEVMNLREDGLSARAIGKLVGLSHASVLDIIHGRFGWERDLRIFVLAEMQERL